MHGVSISYQNRGADKYINDANSLLPWGHAYVVQSFLLLYFNTDIEESVARRLDFVCILHTKSNLPVTLAVNCSIFWFNMQYIVVNIVQIFILLYKILTENVIYKPTGKLWEPYRWDGSLWAVWSAAILFANWTYFHFCRALVKREYLMIFFLISHWNHMLWPLIWAVSLRRFRWRVRTLCFYAELPKLPLSITKFSLFSRALISGTWVLI